MNWKKSITDIKQILSGLFLIWIENAQNLKLYTSVLFNTQRNSSEETLIFKDILREDVLAEN